MPKVAIVSDWTLIRLRPPIRSFSEEGLSPLLSGSSRRSPISGCRRTTSADWLGATFHDGGWFGTSPMVAKTRRIS